MADAEVRVVAHAVGFETIAEQARAATAAIERLAVAARSTSGGQMTAMRQLERDMSRVVNGARLGTTIGKDIQSGIASSIASQSFWSRTFSGLQGRLKAAGRELGNSLAAGVAAGVDAVRNGGGRHGGSGGGRTHVYGGGTHDLHGGIIAGGLSFWGFESIAEAASKREQARLNLRDTGIVSDGQIPSLEGLAKSWKSKFGNISTTEGLEFLKDTVQILGGTEHLFSGHGAGTTLTADAVKGMTRIARLMSYMKTLHGGAHAGDAMNVAGEFANAIRSAEIFGRGTNVDDMADWVARLTKISLATGVSPTAFISAQRAAGASFFALDDKALNIFAAYTQENGPRAGVQLMTSFMHMVGGNNQRVQTNQALSALGLLPNDPKQLRQLQRDRKIKLNAKGEISRVNDMSILKDYQKMAQNPYAWMAEDLYPAIRAKIKHDKGYDIGDIGTPLSERSKGAIVDIMQKIGGAFSQRNEATQAVEALTQWITLQKRAANIDKANANVDARRKSYLAQTQALAAQWDELKVALGNSVLPAVIGVVQMADGALKSVEGFATRHPTLTKLSLLGTGGLAMFNGAISLGLLFSRLLGIGRLFRILEGAALIGTGIVTGIVRAGAALVAPIGGFVGKSGIIRKLTAWINRIPLLGRALTLVGRLSILLGGLPLLAAVGAYGAVNKTDAGGKFWDALTAEAKYRYDKWNGADAKTLEADRKEMERTHQASNKALKKSAKSGVDWLWDRTFGHTDTPREKAEKTLELMERIHPKWMPKHRGVGDIPMPVRRPKVDANGNFLAPDYFGLGDSMPNLGRRRTRADIRAGQKEGPVPVVIADRKNESRPNVINTTVNVHVQTNADPGAIGGAVGSAVASQVQGALSDQHH